MISYYLVRPGSTQEGPFSEDELKGLYHQRTIPPGSYVWTEGWYQWRSCEDAFEWFNSSAKLPPLPPHPGSEGTASHSDTSSTHAEQHEKSFSPDEMKASTAKEYRTLSDWIQNHEVLNQIHRWGLKKLNIGYKSWKLSYYTAIGMGLFFLILIGMLNHKENNDDIVSWENARTQRQISNELQDQRLRQMAQQAIMYNNRIQAEREANKIETCNRCRGAGTCTAGAGGYNMNRPIIVCPTCGGTGQVRHSNNPSPWAL